MEKSFALIYTGKLLPEHSFTAVADRFASAFNLPPAKVKTLLSSTKPRILKRELSWTAAKKYEARLTQLGLQVKLVETGKSPLPSEGASVVTKPASSNRATDNAKTELAGSSPACTDQSIPVESYYAPPKSEISSTGARQNVLTSGWIRLANWVIDYIAYIILSAFVGGLLGYLFGSQAVVALSTPLLKYFFGFLIIFFYYAVMEWTTGRTIGKFITGTKVVCENGGRPTFGQILGRSATRFVPFEGLTFFGSETRGLHDKWPGTYVVKARK